MKAIQRGKGDSATAAAAYRSGEKLIDVRTGIEHDYTRKSQVSYTEVIGYHGTRSELWESVELKHKRGDATPAREVEVSLPVELSNDQKISLARELATEINQRYGVAVDMCIHKINSNNPHAHLLITACTVDNNLMGKKVDALDPISCSRTKPPSPNPSEYLRERWAELTNDALAKSGYSVRVDHRSLKDQGIDREPQIHVGAGWYIANSDRMQTNEAIIELNELKAEQKLLTRLIKTVNASVGFLQAVQIAQGIFNSFKFTHEPTLAPTQTITEAPTEAIAEAILTLEQLIDQDAKRNKAQTAALVARNKARRMGSDDVADA
jgi:hypothetical protein